MGALLTSVIGWLTGGGIKFLVNQWAQLEQMRLAERNSARRVELEREQSRIAAQIETAKVANEDRWSATSLGRYLIVIPFGIWYAAIVADSLFAFPGWDVLALPPAIMRLSEWLVPAIIIGDVGRFAVRRFRR